MQRQAQSFTLSGEAQGCNQSFRSSFGALQAPQALSFTTRSVVGTLDADNPFASISRPSSFFLSDQVAAEVQKSMGTSAFGEAPAGATLLNTATSPALSASPQPSPQLLSSPGASPVSPGVALLNNTLSGPAPSMPVVAPNPGFEMLDTNHDGKLTREEFDRGMVTFSSVPVVPSAGLLIPQTSSLPASGYKSMPALGQNCPPSATPYYTSMPVMGRTAVASAASRYKVGSEVEYYSDDRATWVKAIVQGFNEQAGEYSLDVAPQAPPHKVRTPPSIFVQVPTPPGSGLVSIAALPEPGTTPAGCGMLSSTRITTSPGQVMQSMAAVQPAPAIVTQSLVTAPPPPVTLTQPAASSMVLAPPAYSVAIPTIPSQPVSAMPFVSQAEMGVPAVNPFATAANLPYAGPVGVAASPAAQEPALPESRIIRGACGAPASGMPTPTPSITPPVVEPPPAAPAAEVTEAWQAYTPAPHDTWLPVGQPIVRVEPNWREGRWWYTTAVDFKGLEKLPLGSKQDVLLIADDALQQMEDSGQILPLPAPKSWSETDTCPIT